MLQIVAEKIHEFLDERKFRKYCHHVCDTEQLTPPTTRLGAGGFCDAVQMYKAGKPVTVRIYDFLRGTDVAEDLVVNRHPHENRSTYTREVVVGTYLHKKHPDFPEVISSDSNDERGYIISSYVPGVCLSDAAFSEKEAIRGIAQVAKQVQQMHRLKLLHGDITPGNIIVGVEWRIIDFGSSCSLDASVNNYIGIPELTSPRGAPNYMAPETIMGISDHYSEVFGLAASLSHALTASTPFSMLHANNPSMFECFRTWMEHPEDVHSDFLKSLDGLDPKMADLLGRSLHIDPNQRPLFPVFANELEEMVR